MIKCDYVWLWGGFRVVMGGFLVVLVVTSSYGWLWGGQGWFWVVIGGYGWLWCGTGWLSLVISGFDLLGLLRPTP